MAANATEVSYAAERNIKQTRARAHAHAHTNPYTQESKVQQSNNSNQSAETLGCNIPVGTVRQEALGFGRASICRIGKGYRLFDGCRKSVVDGVGTLLAFNARPCQIFLGNLATKEGTRKGQYDDSKIQTRAFKELRDQTH